MKKLECLLRAFRVQSLTHTLSHHRAEIRNMWWHDVRGFAEAAIVDQASGSHFDTPVIPMAHLHFVVEDDVLEKVVGLIRDEIEGDGYEDECLVVMDAVHEMKPGTVASIG